MYAPPCPGQFGRIRGVGQPWRSASRPTGLGLGGSGMHTHTHTAISGEGTHKFSGRIEGWSRAVFPSHGRSARLQSLHTTNLGVSHGGAGQCSRAIVDSLDFNSGVYRRKEKVTVPEISLNSNPMGFPSVAAQARHSKYVRSMASGSGPVPVCRKVHSTCLSHFARQKRNSKLHWRLCRGERTGSTTK